eukprot:1599083-Rhodomonas_salina.1
MVESLGSKVRYADTRILVRHAVLTRPMVLPGRYHVEDLQSVPVWPALSERIVRAEIKTRRGKGGGGVQGRGGEGERRSESEGGSLRERGAGIFVAA